MENDYICAIGNAFDDNGLNERYYNQYIQEVLKRLNPDDFYIQIIGKELDSSPIAHPDEAAAFILSTRSYEIDSPLKSLELFKPVPLYHLPKTSNNKQEYDDIIAWQRDYQACDDLQMQCRVGEYWALDQMGDIHSELSKQGLEICQILKEKLGKPVYYDLYQYYILPDEQNRKCPKCGGEWLLEEPLHNEYDFKCDTCCLLSNFGYREMD